MAADAVGRGIGVKLLRRLVVDVLAEGGDQVTRVVELVVERPHLGIQREEAHAAVAVRIQPAEHDLPRRLANGDDGVGVLEAKPLGRQPVDVRREVFHRPAIDAAGIEVHVIRGEEQDVQRRRCVKRGQREEEQGGSGGQWFHLCDGVMDHSNRRSSFALNSGPALR